MSTPRHKRADRRRELAEAALAELADTPLSELTTRQVARRVGISQPALFRHFRSREALLLATAQQATAELEGRISELLGRPGDSRAQLARLAQGLAAYVTEQPGLPRLLFSAPSMASSALRTTLAQLSHAQQNLATALVLEGQGSGQIRPDLVAEDAGLLFFGMILGAVHAWRALAPGARFNLGERIAALFELWWLGVARDPEQPSDAEQPCPPEQPTGATPTAGPLLDHLDVRPILASGRDPLDQILARLDALSPLGVLVLTVPFRPTPLLALLHRRALQTTVRALEAKLFAVIIHSGPASQLEAVLDLTDLAPPRPLERILCQAAELQPDQARLYLLPRYPRMLLPHLDARALSHRSLELADGSTLLHLSLNP